MICPETSMIALITIRSPVVTYTIGSGSAALYYVSNIGPAASLVAYTATILAHFACEILASFLPNTTRIGTFIDTCPV